MASALDLVLKNFKWRIETISPTHQRPGKDFRWLDPDRVDPDSTRGAVRGFIVYWNGSGPDGEDEMPTDITERAATHSFTLEVYYPSDAYEKVLLQTIISQDRHDLIKQLRTTDYYDGIDSANTTTETGLWARVRDEDELDRGSEPTWVLRQTWRCTINESE